MWPFKRNRKPKCTDCIYAYRYGNYDATPYCMYYEEEDDFGPYISIRQVRNNVHAIVKNSTAPEWVVWYATYFHRAKGGSCGPEGRAFVPKDNAKDKYVQYEKNGLWERK